MRQLGASRQLFEYRHGRGRFATLFFIDLDPWRLILTARGAVPPLSLSFDVRPGFHVDAQLSPEVYKALCKYLGLEFDPANPFSPRGFLLQFNAAIPRMAQAIRVPTSREILEYYLDIEERDRPFFLTYRPHQPPRGPTAKNLDKTLLLLGAAAFHACRVSRISSVWTDNERLAREPPAIVPCALQSASSDGLDGR